MTTVYVAIVAAVLAAEPAKTPLDDLGGLLGGRWIGDVTLIADWPGVGKRGERVVSYVNIEWTTDGHALEIDSHGGTGSNREIVVWDAGEKKVRSLGVSSGGSSWQAVWSKKGDLWTARSVEFLADGTKVAGSTIIFTPEDGGKKLVITNQGDAFMGDKKLAPLRDVYTKLGTEGAPDTPLQEYGKLIVGRWRGDIEWLIDWPGVGKKGDKVVAHHTNRWTADRRAIVCTWYGGQGSGHAVVVWDPVAKKIREFSVNSGGASFVAMIAKKGDQWEWTLSGSLADGTPQKGTGTIVFSDGGKKQDVKGDLVVGKEEVSFVDPYTRLGD